MLEVRDEAALTAPSAGVQGWTSERPLYRQPFNDLLFKAQSVHRQHFDRVQLSRRLNIKTGHCSQSSHHTTHCNG